jgi:hypothetical protein
MEFSVDDVKEMYPYSSLGFPAFDFSPFDYLTFARKSHSTNTPESRVDCISHLKHAVDCELDMFLHVLGFKKLEHVHKKLYIVEMGVFDVRSLRKLNRIRNKVEHEYMDPSAEDLEVFFDLVQSFVNALDGLLFMVAVSPYLVWGNGKSWFTVYVGASSIDFTIGHNVDDQEEMIVDASTLDDFILAIRIYFLLCRARCLISMGSLVSELKYLLGQTLMGSYQRPESETIEPTSIEEFLGLLGE